MEKFDLKKELAQFYPSGASARTTHLVEVPEMQFLMMDGTGDPNTSQRFEEATAALYSVSYALKFASKAAGKDYAVMPLEGLWWSEDHAVFRFDRRDEWLWTLMIVQPDFVSEESIREAIATAHAQGKLTDVQARDLRIERLREGRAVQVLHVGPYETEAPVIAAMHEFAAGQGLRLSGKHHEIYLGDPRKSAPEKLKTVLRQPVQ